MNTIAPANLDPWLGPVIAHITDVTPDGQVTKYAVNGRLCKRERQYWPACWSILTPPAYLNVVFPLPLRSITVFPEGDEKHPLLHYSGLTQL